MYLTILCLPLLGALFSVNRKCGLKGGPILSTIMMIITALLGTIIWIEIGFGGSPVSLVITEWIITSNLLNVEWGLVFDSLTAAMLIPVLYISALVQLYSLGYMSADPHRPRFFSYLSLFTFFMLILLIGENLLVLFVGWEGVGLASYLLINFWFTRIAANMAALKAFLMNRVGDWGLTLGIITTICIIDDVSFSNILSIGLYMNTDIVFILSILFLIGAAAKSAQVGLSAWLASAMEGPTPVSALIHAATMVTAGIYLLMRLSPLLEWSSNSLLLVTWLGGMSALLGAACGLLENDLKRVIAFSTTSQLGYMVIACGLSQYNISLFHLINHAFFKALLFLSAGAVIHAVVDQQDMRKMGGLILFLPFSYAGILLGSLSLMAFPFMTGFYSKDLILELALIPKNYTRSIAYIFAIFAAFLSALYSIRLLIFTFISKPHFPYSLILNKTIIDPNFSMLFPLILLAMGAAFFGYLAHVVFLSWGSTLYFNSIFIHPNNIALLDGTMIPSFDMEGLGALPTISILKYLPIFFIVLLFSLKIMPFFVSPSVQEGLGALPSRDRQVRLDMDANPVCTTGLDIRPSSSIQDSLSLTAASIDSCAITMRIPYALRYNDSTNLKIRHNVVVADRSWIKKTISFSALTINHFNIYNHYIILNFLISSNIILRYWDRGLVETMGPLGLVQMFHFLAFKIESFATGRLIQYAFTIIFSALIIALFTYTFSWDWFFTLVYGDWNIHLNKPILKKI